MMYGRDAGAKIQNPGKIFLVRNYSVKKHTEKSRKSKEEKKKWVCGGTKFSQEVSGRGSRAEWFLIHRPSSPALSVCSVWSVWGNSSLGGQPSNLGFSSLPIKDTSHLAPHLVNGLLW